VTFPREQVVASLPGAPAATVLAGLTRPFGARARVRPRESRPSGRDGPRRRRAVGSSSPTTRTWPRPIRSSSPGSRRRAVRSHPRPSSPRKRILASSFPILSLNVEGPYPAEQRTSWRSTHCGPRLGLAGRRAGFGPVLGRARDGSAARSRTAWSRAPHRSRRRDRLRTRTAYQTVARLTEQHELALAVVTGEMTTAEEIAQTVVGGTPAPRVRISDPDRWARGIVPRTTIIRVDGKRARFQRGAAGVGRHPLLDAASWTS